MIYEKTLKQLNTVFPTFNIKMPTKKATLRSLVQEIQCPSLTNNDFALLRNPQTASKPLGKLSKIINTWMKIIEQNEKARQQQQTRPINRKNIQEMQQLLSQCKLISSKSEFVMLISKKGGDLFKASESSLSMKDYKEIYICKQIEFYNTITSIQEEEYFRCLEDLNESLGTIGQLINKTTNNIAYLEQFYDYIENHELFKKKDNILNKVINYNLNKTIKVIESIEKTNKLLFCYQQQLIFSIVRVYYLIYLSRKEIQNNINNANYLSSIETFLCQKNQKIFPQIYSRKISKSLIMLDQIRSSFMNKKQTKNEIKASDRNNIKNEIFRIHQELKQNSAIKITESQFLQTYEKIQSLVLKLQSFISIQPNNQEWIRQKEILQECETLSIKNFSNEEIKNYKNSKRNLISTEKTGLHLIPLNKDSNTTNLSYKLNSSIKNTLNERGNKNRRNGQEIDIGEDVFLYDALENSPETYKERVNKINLKQHGRECENFLNKIQPGFGERLYDAGNLDLQEMNALLSVGPASNLKDVIQMISKNVLKPEITESNIERIFKPWLRFQVLKMLHEKLVQMSYKIAKILESSNFNSLPQNIKEFILKRNLFLKTVNKQLQKVLDIANIINQIQFKVFYEVSEQSTYNVFLKVLLAHKETKAYQFSFKDQKQFSKEGVIFVNTKIYSPFIESLSTLLPEPYQSPQQIINILDYIEFFVDFKRETSEIIARHVEFIETEKDKNTKQSLKRELSRILKKWTEKYETLIQNKISTFDYKLSDQQFLIVKEVIMACNNQNVKNIQNPIAIKIYKSK